MLKGSVPIESDWGNFKDDFDIEDAYLKFSGKSNEYIQKELKNNALELMELYRFIPEVPFSYYFVGLVNFINSGNFSDVDAADITSYFIDVVEYILKTEPDKILPLVDIVMNSIEHIALNQKKYHAQVDVYGDYMIKYLNIRDLFYSDSL